MQSWQPLSELLLVKGAAAWQLLLAESHQASPAVLGLFCMQRPAVVAVAPAAAAAAAVLAAMVACMVQAEVLGRSNVAGNLW